MPRRCVLLDLFQDKISGQPTRAELCLHSGPWYKLRLRNYVLVLPCHVLLIVVTVVQGNLQLADLESFFKSIALWPQNTYIHYLTNPRKIARVSWTLRAQTKRCNIGDRDALNKTVGLHDFAFPMLNLGFPFSADRRPVAPAGSCRSSSL